MSNHEKITFSVPDILSEDIEVSEVYGNFTQTGKLSSFGIDLEFRPLKLIKTLKSSDLNLLPAKVEQTLHGWEKKYQSHLDREAKAKQQTDVDELNRELESQKAELSNLLMYTLGVDDTVDWSSLHRDEPFKLSPERQVSNTKYRSAIQFSRFGHPESYSKTVAPSPPTLESHRKEFGFFTRLFLPGRVKSEFEAKVQKHEQEINKTDKFNKKLASEYSKAVEEFAKQKAAFEREQQADNEAADQLRNRYENGRKDAVQDYCDLVLSNSVYPECVPRNWELEYHPESKMVVVQMDLPPPESLPVLAEYKYVKSKNEVSEKVLSKAAVKAQFESVIYQICIRTIHELFEADQVGALDSVVFNGAVTSVNPGTGIQETKIIASCSAAKPEFLAFDLSRVDPKACFKQIKGVAASALVDLSPIPPVVQLTKTDKRFVEGKEIVDRVGSGTNLAAMDWQDFEHLIRELFEKEFAGNGGEVHVTQGSSDGGVDAVAFDPDPIRGGKIVIQAKRYTNTVGVAAVRDLYGTVMNEGATKGILVTTTDFGSDSYNFAKDKPLTLINGNNLLSLLEKHGHTARINVKEAKNLI